MLSAAALHAANRFGLGIRPADTAGLSADPQDWLQQQIPAKGTAAPLPAALTAGLKSAQAQAGAFYAYRQAKQKDQAAAEKAAREVLRQGIVAEMSALLQAQLQSDAPFAERWVQFWANHFTVAGRDQIVLALAGAYEREAIRPHAFGRFSDMLIGVTGHPAMLLYLDNASSFGPSSRVGERRPLGLNENHAREILELHTVSPAAGYTQTDVIALAKILTGWSVGRSVFDGCSLGAACFRQAMHEPWSQKLLGYEFPQQSADQGIAALQMLAAHPATARHVAWKLARHFIADDPPDAAVAKLERTFLETRGDLRQLALTLVALPEAWDPQYRKLRNPRDFLLAALRLSDADLPMQRCIGLLRQFGQAPFQPPSPAGWPDRANDWMAPDALRQRIELSYVIAQRTRNAAEPMDLFELALGPLARSDTRHAVQRAESRPAALATILAAPEFQWR
jgi:uncharacterized protein (DUF1800 family)